LAVFASKKSGSKKEDRTCHTSNAYKISDRVAQSTTDVKLNLSKALVLF
jgi:hypothetical protein